MSGLARLWNRLRTDHPNLEGFAASFLACRWWNSWLRSRNLGFVRITQITQKQYSPTKTNKVSPKRKKIPRKKDFNEEALITSHSHNHLSLNASLDSQFSGVLFCRENLLNLTKAHSIQSCRPCRKHETNICNLSNTSGKAKQEKTNKRISE